jgi:hypothetical protein
LKGSMVFVMRLSAQSAGMSLVVAFLHPIALDARKRQSWKV